MLLPFKAAFMIWLDFVALCRLSGYHGELPQSVGSFWAFAL